MKLCDLDSEIGDFASQVPDLHPNWSAHELLAQLPDDLCDIATRHWIGGTSLRDVAVAVGSSFKAVRLRVARAKLLLKGVIHECHGCTN